MNLARALAATIFSIVPAFATYAQPEPSPAVTASTANAPQVRSATGQNGASVPFLLSMPADHDPAKPAKVLIALPPGTQSADVARASLDRTFGQALLDRAYIVAMPYVGEGDPQLSLPQFDLLLEHLSASFSLDKDQVLLAGVQNGGKAAFRIAMARPDRIRALVVLPGLPPETSDESELAPLNGLPIAMFVGSSDSRWRSESEVAHAALTRIGARCSLTIVEGDGHMLPSVTPAIVADTLDRLTRLAAGITAEAEVGAMLDAWHAAAAAADEDAYFSLFADDSSIFMGTDATERWTAPEFRAWAKPYFDRGRAWAFKVVKRHAYLSPDESVAWFDEVLDTPNMGPCRGSGVAVKRDGNWKVAHYNLTVPVPNAILDKVVEMVAQELKNPTSPPPSAAPESAPPR